MGVNERNIEALAQRVKMLTEENQKIIQILKVMENNLGTANNRIQTLEKHLQLLVAGQYGSGPTVK